jgi:hypothetical protein
MGEYTLMKRNMAQAVLVLMTLVGTFFALEIRPIHAQGTLYDDFSSKELNADRWTGQTSGSGGLELIRQPVFGKLLMSHRVTGDTSASTGQRESRNQLRFRNGTAVNTVKFELQVKDFSVLGCEASGSAISRSLAGFFSALFNDGSSTTSGDQTGDVGAFIFLYRTSDSSDASNVLRVEAGMVRCSSSDCSTVDDLGLLDLGMVSKNERVSLWLTWEAAENRVRFQKNDEPIQTVNYSQTDAILRGFRVLEVRGEAANCNIGTRPYAKINAAFDNIFVNP